MQPSHRYHQALVQLTKDVTQALDGAGITYWLDGGSLLGAVRAGGRLLHDDDVDLAVPLEDVVALLPALFRLEEQGYALDVTDECVKICQPRTAEPPYGNATLDLFVYEREDRRMQLGTPEGRTKWPGCYHELSDLWPLRTVSFDGLELWCPARPEPYLDRLYPEWRTKVVVYPPHLEHGVQHPGQEEAQHVDAHGVPQLLPKLTV